MRDSRARLGEDQWRLMVGFHRLLLRLGGRIPDETLAALREMLGSSEFFQLPMVVSGTLAELKISLSVGEVAFLREMAMYLFQDPEPPGIDLIPIAGSVPPTGHRFLPVRGEVWAEFGERIPPRFSFVGGESEGLFDLPPEWAHLDDISLRLADVPDHTSESYLSIQPDVLTAWRAWRFPAADELTGGVRILLVELAQDGPAWELTRQLQKELGRDGVQDPQVEVFWTGTELTPYHRAALDGAAKIWQQS